MTIPNTDPTTQFTSPNYEMLTAVARQFLLTEPKPEPDDPDPTYTENRRWLLMCESAMTDARRAR